jgi:hypothetical protein
MKGVAPTACAVEEASQADPTQGVWKSGQSGMDPLDGVAAFARVVESGSVWTAARRLKISKSAVSPLDFGEIDGVHDIGAAVAEVSRNIVDIDAEIACESWNRD